MTPKALAAIALTLIVIVPIGLGYALAVEDHDVQVVKTTDSHNISDSMLNAEAAYYRSSTSITNNSELINTGYGNVHYVSTPNYVATSSTYSSIPVYSKIADHFEIQSFAREYDTAIGVNYPSGTAVTPADYMHFNVYDFCELKLLVGGTTISAWTDDEITAWSCGTTYTVNYLDYNEDTEEYTNVTKEGVTGFYIGHGSDITYEGGTYTRYYLGSGSIAAFHPARYSTALKLVTSAGTTYVCSESKTLVVMPTSVLFGDVLYTDVSEIYIADCMSMDCTTNTPTGSYAKPSAGWTLPQTPSFWLNNQTVHSVTFSVNLENGESATFVPGDWTTAGTDVLTVLNYNGTIYASDVSNPTPVKLGTYTKIQVTVSTDGYTVSGVSEWPTMGTKANVVNSIKIASSHDDFTSVRLTGTNVEFRCDSTSVFAGTFPVTKDYVLNLSTMYPGTQTAVKLNSIGVYGDSISFGSNTYSVTDGKITIGDSTYSLKGAMISWNDDGVVCINNKATGITGSTVTFGGEWSLTSTAYELSTSTETVSEWTPGVFALDAGGICAAGLLTAGACMVLLGMTGRRSGAKAGLLLLVCGGAAAAYLIII